LESELSSASLLEHAIEPGFRASVISTYNCYFPFYEEVVLRRMVASGCTHNVLMVDATRCAEAFASEELRPRRAGRDYTLIPVRVGGAFHPKILLRVGKSKGALFVGSHNLTLSGFGLNDEITNAFRVGGASIRNGAGPLRQAFDYLAGFVPSGLPDLVEAFAGLKLGVPWMSGPVGVDDEDRRVLFHSKSSEELWSQITPILPSKVATAFVCGPFFDPKLAFLRRVLTDVKPRELVVGIDPASVDIDPAEAARLPGVRFVNVAGVAKVPQRREGSRPYLHAKLLWFSGTDGQLLISGSANPSVAAFLAVPSARNAEAVVADRRAGADKAIGIAALMAAPIVTADDWQTVDQRRAIEAAERKPDPTGRVLVATPTAAGFLAQEALPAGTVLQGVGDDGALLGEASVRGAVATAIDAPEAVREGARFLESRSPGSELLLVVHRSEEISRNLGDTRKALRTALGGLEEDPAQLEALLKLTEKVIFDSEEIVRPTPMRSASAGAPAAEPVPAPESLAVDAAGRRQSRRRKSLASGDIVVLLDALMHRLGEGLSADAVARPPSEEEGIGADDEEGGELARVVPEFEALSKACRGKVRRLIKRMKEQLELAEQPDCARRGIIQLAAVLSVICTLRHVEQRPEWRRRRLKLVEPEDEQSLFETAALLTAWGADSLALRAIAENENESFDELSTVVGLLVWLIWEIEVDLDASSQRGGLEGLENDSWYIADLLVGLSPFLVGDTRAMELLRQSVGRTPHYHVDGDRWLRVHINLASHAAAVVADPERFAKGGRTLHPGDLVVLPASDPRVRVVQMVVETGSDPNVVLFEATSETSRRTFKGSRVRSLAWSSADAVVIETKSA